MSEHETWYETYNGRIIAVKVAGHTDQTVMLDLGNNKTRRKARESSYSSFFPTWREAKSHLERVSRRELEFARQRLDTARSRLATIQAMKEPDNE